MNTRKAHMATLMLAIGLSGTAQAALQGRDLDGNLSTSEAYYDTVLDITWLADANYAKTSGYDADGLMKWDEANTWAANLSFTDGVHTYNNWRLPTVEPVNGVSFNYGFSYSGSADEGYNITSPQSAMAYMFYVNLGNPSNHTTAGIESGCFVNTSDTCLDNTGPFSNIVPDDVYWSATVYPQNNERAWSFYMYDGAQRVILKFNNKPAWAVSPGDVGIAVTVAVPEADTWVTILVGLGFVGAAARRRGLMG